MSDLTGKVLDRKYTLVRQIGEGGMGSVWVAEHKILHRKVAVKILHPEHTSKPQSVERFFLEAQTASSIGHPNIIEIQDVGREEDGTVYIVMELLRGRSLKVLMREDRKLPPSRAVAIIVQVLSALHAAHDKGIIHRDLKPDNIFLSIDPHGREEIKLLDFGIAKFQGDKTFDLGLTKTGVVLGTPNYLAPEQARGLKDIDNRIDIWSAGVLLYEMLAGRLPFEGKTYNEVMGLIILEEPPPVRQFCQQASEQLEKVISKAMTKDRDERYHSVAEMIQDLRSLVDAYAEELMSQSAVQALRTTVPPPAMLPTDDNFRTTAELDARASATDIENTPISDSQPPEPRTPSSAEVYDPDKFSLTNKVILAATVFIAGGLLITILVVFLSGETVTKIPMEQKGANLSQIVDDMPAPVLPVDSEPQDTTSAEDTAPRDTDTKEPPAPQTVQIQLNNLPENAKVYIEGKEVELPIALLQSTNEVELRVSATGYEDFTDTIIPQEDSKIDLSMKKTKKRAKIRRKKKRRTSTKPKGTSSGSGGEKDWAPNPFGKK